MLRGSRAYGGFVLRKQSRESFGTQFRHYSETLKTHDEKNSA
jgi:hypothetical protein